MKAFNQKDIMEWEEAVDEKRFNRYKREKVYKDPKRERLYKARKNHKWRYPANGRESTIARKLWQRSFRARMKDELKHHRYHKPVPHEYKSYGYETW